MRSCQSLRLLRSIASSLVSVVTRLRARVRERESFESSPGGRGTLIMIRSRSEARQPSHRRSSLLLTHSLPLFLWDSRSRRRSSKRFGRGDWIGPTAKGCGRVSVAEGQRQGRGFVSAYTSLDLLFSRLLLLIFLPLFLFLGSLAPHDLLTLFLLLLLPLQAARGQAFVQRIFCTFLPLSCRFSSCLQK